MRNITVKDIGKSYGSKTILSDISFTFAEGTRLAVVGENGAGKTTLLKILSGQMEYDEGEIFGQDAGCLYISQDFSGISTETPYAFLIRTTPNISAAMKLLESSGFNFGKNQYRLNEITCGDLSGGEQKKLEISASLASNARFIAFDEPENHLDYKTIEWLIARIKEYAGGVIFISHDQYLIDQLADTILELERGMLTVYTMSYEEYLAEKKRHIEGLAREWTVEEKTIARLHDTVEMLKMKTKVTDSGVATYRQTKRRYEELKENHGSKPSAEIDGPTISASSVERKNGKVIAALKDLSFSYGDAKVLKSVSAEIFFGEKIVLFGDNGAGKSTLIKLLTGQLEPTNGVATLGTNIQWQMMTQDHLKDIDPNKSALKVFQESLAWDETKSRAQLARYGIRADQVLRPLKDLSGGQQARFKLSLTFAQKPELLILDEPTNHVDPPTWDAIVEAIKGFQGTVIAVTHDRAFIDAISQKLWILENGKIKVELGTLSEYLQKEKNSEML
jgi:ATPase subunit of ABC transporter with duplicated ATPase domains